MGGALAGAWNKVRWSVQKRGIGGTARQMVQRLLRRRGEERVEVHPFDERYGMDTSGLIGGGSLAEGNANDRFSSAYYGVAPSRLKMVVERWQATEGTRSMGEYTFVDIGSGKGRALMVASEMGFREVVGVELSSALAQVADKNLERWRGMGLARSPVRLVQGDATEVELPAGPLLVLMNNPFYAPAMRLMLRRLEAFAGDRVGEIDVLYVIPEQEAVFAEFGGFQRLWSEQVGMSEEDGAADLVSSPEDRCSLYRR